MKMSENEYGIMKVFWKEGRPLSRSEILKATDGRNWNPASVHLILNAMISKNFIRITDESKNYKRTYESVMTREDYLSEILRDAFPDRELMDVLKDCVKLQNKLKK